MTKPESYRLQREKSASPKRSPKPGRHKETEIKDYGPIDGDKNYPPHAYSRSNSGISLKHTNISSGSSTTRTGLPSLPNGTSHSQNGQQPDRSKLRTPVGSGVSGIPSPRGNPPAPPAR